MIQVQMWLRLKNSRFPSSAYAGTTEEVIGNGIIPGRVSESIDEERNLVYERPSHHAHPTNLLPYLPFEGPRELFFSGEFLLCAGV